MIPRAQSELLLNAVKALKEVGLTEKDIAAKLEYDSVSELRVARTQARIALREIEVPDQVEYERIRQARVWVDKFRQEYENLPALEKLEELAVLTFISHDKGVWQAILQIPEENEERDFYLVIFKPHRHTIRITKCRTLMRSVETAEAKV